DVARIEFRHIVRLTPGKGEALGGRDRTINYKRRVLAVAAQNAAVRNLVARPHIGACAIVQIGENDNSGDGSEQKSAHVRRDIVNATEFRIPDRSVRSAGGGRSRSRSPG